MLAGVPNVARLTEFNGANCFTLRPDAKKLFLFNLYRLIISFGRVPFVNCFEYFLAEKIGFQCKVTRLFYSIYTVALDPS